MKIAVVVLVVLGLVAAGAAAFLFQWYQVYQANKVEKAPEMAQVLVVQADLPARTRIVKAHVAVEKVARVGLPQGYYTNETQAIGKTLKRAVSKGQALSGSCFLPENAIDDLLRPGMLAFQIPLSRRTGAASQLYPGCIVDVFATFPLRDREKGDAVTTPLLQNIQVLGVRDETVITTEAQEAEKGKKGKTAPRPVISRGGDNMTVILEVTSRQAAALQLVMERGTIGLAMRNPLDKQWNPMEPMVVKEGQLTAASQALDPQDLAFVNQLQQMLNSGDPNRIILPVAKQTTTPAPAPDPNVLPVVGPVVAPGILDKRPKTATVIVYRGTKRTDEEVPSQEALEEGQELAPEEQPAVPQESGG
jgi:Flp pilus assembly protein CpaB